MVLVVTSDRSVLLVAWRVAVMIATTDGLPSSYQRGMVVSKSDEPAPTAGSCYYFLLVFIVNSTDGSLNVNENYTCLLYTSRCV